MFCSEELIFNVTDQCIRYIRLSQDLMILSDKDLLRTAFLEFPSVVSRLA
jgi:hypothetical protein